MTENIKIWEKILPELVKKIKKAENDSYSINLLEEVKMANKFVRETMTNEGKNVSLRVNVDENANSRILAKLFQYKSPDGEYEILQSLLDYISNRDENAVLNFGNIKIDNDNTIITTEETLNQETQNEDNGRIDILVRTGDYAIIFENKLFNAPDQEHQLAKYIKKVKGVKETNDKNKNKSKYDANNIFVIYLSRDGNEPAEDSWVDHDTKSSYSASFASRYANISFREDILPWLKDYVLPNVRKKDTDLESALVQYINYLKLEFMMNNDDLDLTKWLKDKLKNIQQWKDSNETGRLEKVEELLDYLSEEGKKGLKNRNYSVQQLRKLIGKTNDNTNEDPLEETDLLNKVIAVIKNLRDDCRNKVLGPFYHVSENYFDIIHASSLSAAYCWMKKEKWEDVKFQWQPFFIIDKEGKDSQLCIKNTTDGTYEYNLKLNIILKNVIGKENKTKKIDMFKTISKSANELMGKEIDCKKMAKISYKILEATEPGENTREYPLLQLVLTTTGKLIEFKEDDQKELFTAIYDSLSGVIKAIDAKYP